MTCRLAFHPNSSERGSERSAATLPSSSMWQENYLFGHGVWLVGVVLFIGCGQWAWLLYLNQF